MTPTMRYPFEASLHEILEDVDTYVASVFTSLESEFLVLPKGKGFIEYDIFENGYESLKRNTNGFHELTPHNVVQAISETPIVVIVLRTMLGFTPSEWAYIATQRTGIQVSQGFARGLDRKIRLDLGSKLSQSATTQQRVRALVETACQVLREGKSDVDRSQLHRLDKADTHLGLESVQTLASMGVPYAMLLYERFLGRPFASRRDSVSGLIGDSLENAIETILFQAQASYRRTGRAERIEGFDQAPDFCIPSEYNPQIVIEAKITEDDGTARDKVTRIQHLSELSSRRHKPFEVVACIGGRGFGVRREDMRKLLVATRGKVFTRKTLDQLVEHTGIQQYRAGHAPKSRESQEP